VPKRTKGKKGGEAETGGFPPLPDAVEGEVVTRFPPEASGYLHIGHVKAMMINNHYARHYKGKLIVRFDDTNPSKEKQEYEDAIISDLASLEVRPDIVSHTSDHFETIIALARKMITEGNAYMDDTPQEQMRNERMDGIESKNKHASVEVNQRKFEEMLAGKAPSWCMRANMNMSNPNKCCRDPVMFRANDTPHARTGSTYKAYPTYDLACPIVDSIEGVTHAMRTMEYRDRDEMYYWLIEKLGLRPVKLVEFSRLNFLYTVLSKRKLTWFVEEKLVWGWNDPRFPTVQGFLRRGLTVKALRDFIATQGFSRRTVDMEWDKVFSMNRALIDPVAPRFTAVSKAGAVPITFTNGPDGLTTSTAPLHPKNPEVGTKMVTYAPRVWLDAEDASGIAVDQKITLMKWGNCFVKEVTKDADGKITSVVGELSDDKDFKKTVKMTWLADFDGLVDAELHEFDFLITKGKILDGENFADYVNPSTHAMVEAFGDPALRSAKAGDIVQIERRGFYRVDRAYGGPGKPVVLFNVPDGKTKGSGLTSQIAKKTR
jgi:glutamyl-tRNA synthetase